MNLYQGGYEEYPLKWVIGQNLFFLLYFGIGAAGIWPLAIYRIPVVCILYVIFLILMLVFVLRKHLCTGCYYYGKRCSTGWGLLAAKLYAKDSGNYHLGLKMAGFTWASATLVPLIGMVIVLLMGFSLTELALLVLFLALTPVNLLLHKGACTRCRMRFACPGSMAKENGKKNQG